jgi:hypothetical protein
MLDDSTTKRDAIAVCEATHAIIKGQNNRKVAIYRTTYESYGQRLSLEMFGVSKHGRLATRTKEPVGNGTKVYAR